MQPDKQSATDNKEKEVVETSVKPAFPLISNQPERFGVLSELFLFIEEKRLYDLLNMVKGYAVKAACFLALPIIGRVVWRFYHEDPYNGMLMDITKILFIYMLLGALAALIAIWVYRKKIMEILAQLEDLAYFGDDMARFYMPYARSELKDFNDKLHKHKEQPDMPSSFEIVRDLWPVISMVLKRDPNIIKWGSIGFKVYKTLSAFFKGPSHSEPT